MVSWSWARGVGVLLALIASSLASPADAAIPSRVYLNGVPSPVYFNDGDSFRVLAGKFAGSKARLAGYNTLESYGPVHFWGLQHGYDFYDNAKAGTELAKSQVWECMSRDGGGGYGRTHSEG